MDRRTFVQAGMAGAGMAGLGAAFDLEASTGDPEAPDPRLSAAAEGDVVVVKDVPVPMRDGLELMTDFYLPAENGVPLERQLPAVLARTPYDKMRPISIEHAMFFARNGYVSVVQDCRGRFASPGDFFPFVQEPEDGYDAVEWVARHPACDGQVGTYGVSYQAWVQFETATLNPPSLKTMIPYEGPTNAYTYSMKGGGALHLGLLQWVLSVASNGNEARANPQITEAINEMRTGQGFLEWASRIPWRRGETPLSLAPTYEEAAFQLYFENYDYGDFWRQPGLGMDEHFESFPDMPILWVVGWFDWYPRTISDGYQAMVRMGRENQHILIGPWTHNNFESSIGDVNFGQQGARIRVYDDYLNLELRWFDRWLKGDESADVWAPAKYFIMGGGDGRRTENGRIDQGGEWRYEESWPPTESEDTAFYLHEGGALAPERPSERTSSTTYTYDPRNTVSSNGRCIVAYGPALEFGFQGMGPRDQIEMETLPGHGIPGMPIASRPDVLVFQSAPLAAELTIAGNLTAVLHVSSDAPDTDFYVKLLDVHPSSPDYPSGYAFPVSEGILRARYRESFEQPRLMEAGEVYRLEFPLEPSANLFKAGHRIRVDVYSSSFPNFDINRNTGDPNDRTWRVANNTIHHDTTRPSYVSLPVLA
ncbi:CocE/NonD family hydrolase [Candidatus Palauibacter sp.]|uniref:CocE/NonD family hydrolase n=1 Tax=Candidatus Palauibacter sp. TaxID=3101350 RepID=UPI003B5A3792